MIKILVNGTPTEVAPGTVLIDLLARFTLTKRRWAVEINQEVIPRSLHNVYLLADGDRIEIIEAVGGG